ITFSDPQTTALSTLSLHDALPIFVGLHALGRLRARLRQRHEVVGGLARTLAHRSVVAGGEVDVLQHGLDPPCEPGQRLALDALRSEEHTSELQSRETLVCRLLLEK